MLYTCAVIQYLYPAYYRLYQQSNTVYVDVDVYVDDGYTDTGTGR